LREERLLEPVVYDLAVLAPEIGEDDAADQQTEPASHGREQEDVSPSQPDRGSGDFDFYRQIKNLLLSYDDSDAEMASRVQQKDTQADTGKLRCVLECDFGDSLTERPARRKTARPA
jgi:hypothetical protein